MKRKILFILHIPPPIHGSSVVGQQILNSKLITDNFECRYINLSTSIKLDEIGQKNPIKLFRYLLILTRVLFQLISFKPGLCYFAITAKGPAFYKDFTIIFIIKMFGRKIVYHFHNKGVITKQDRLIDNILYRFAFRNSKAIILSKLLYADIKKYFLQEDTYVCPNGISNADIKYSKFSDEAEPKILFLSNMMESKGVYVLLEALKILRNTSIAFSCTFAGAWKDITADGFYTKLDELDLRENVFYLGKKYGDEKERLFEQADIFTFPTFYEFETFGLVNLEAMKHNLPIISTFEGGIPDIIKDGETGFLVPQKDSQALAQKLEILN